MRISDGIFFIFILFIFLILFGVLFYSFIVICIDVLLLYVICDDDLIFGICNKLLNLMVFYGDNFI